MAGRRRGRRGQGRRDPFGSLGGGGFDGRGGFPPGGAGGMPPGGFPPGTPPGGSAPFFGFPWALWSLFRRNPRARRGDVRAAILTLLSEQPRNGYQIMRELEHRSQGAWRPSPGSVYPALAQLEDEGLVRTEASAANPGGRVFTLTPQGRSYVAEHRDELAAAWETASPVLQDAHVIAAITQLRHIASAAMHVMHTGNTGQIAEALKTLNDARRTLYRLLADDVGPEEPDE